MKYFNESSTVVQSDSDGWRAAITVPMKANIPQVSFSINCYCVIHDFYASEHIVPSRICMCVM